MRIIWLVLFTCLISTFAWADNSFEPLLNTVSLQFESQQWVTTKNAVVTVGVNASMSGSALEKAQTEILTKLNQISNKGEWHIVSFTRSLDQSGLERVQISAEARIPSSDLGGLRDKAKAISTPGQTFTLDDVAFTPSADEIRDAKTSLRNNIYQQIKSEMANLNKTYPDQKYYLHSMNVMGEVAPLPQANMMVRVASKMDSSGNSMAVGNKLTLTAVAVFASAPNADVIKLVHN